MGQHALIALSGILISYPIYLSRKSSGRALPSKNYAILSIPIIAGIVVFWHLPAFWDGAVLNPLVHGVEHFSFFAVGLIVGFFFPAMPDNFKFMSIFLAASGHMVYGLYLLVAGTPVYPIYPLGQQVLLAELMLFPSPLYFIGLIVASLSRETKRLEQLEVVSGGLYIVGGESYVTSQEVQPTERSPSSSPSSSPPSSSASPKGGSFQPRRIIVPIATILLIAVFVGYLAVTGGMIYFSSASTADPGHANHATVYILETPVTWQYSPQNIVVVIGVNNTVVWTSHSLSEDTVRSSTGIFNSGALHPGQSWSYTFTKPGVYNYSCAFHPWMKGSVTVLGS
jgi:plastocyanin